MTNEVIGRRFDGNPDVKWEVVNFTLEIVCVRRRAYTAGIKHNAAEFSRFV